MGHMLPDSSFRSYQKLQNILIWEKFILLKLQVKLKIKPSVPKLAETPQPGLNIEANCAAVAVWLLVHYLPTVGTASSVVVAGTSHAREILSQPQLQPNSTSTRVGVDKVISRTTTPPHQLSTKHLPTS